MKIILFLAIGYVIVGLYVLIFALCRISDQADRRAGYSKSPLDKE
jgi:hypothetical protein